MNQLTSAYLARAEAGLFITTLVYFLMNGAQIFETAVIVPKWTAAPPQSFQLFRGPYGLDLKAFWITIHTIHEVTFMVAIGLCWQIDPVRNGLLVLFGIHMAVRIWTLGYFAPAIIDFQKQANMLQPAPDLLNKTALWRTLNYIRVGLFVAVSIGLIPLCMKLMTRS